MTEKNNPGPGAYTGTKKDSGGFYIGQKLKKKEIVNSPGPANYNPKIDLTRKASPRYGLRSRDEKANLFPGKGTPGPGAYSSNDGKTKQGGFIGHSGRSKEPVKDVPGPGQYKIPVKLAWTPKYLLPDKPEDVKYV